MYRCGQIPLLRFDALSTYEIIGVVFYNALLLFCLMIMSKQLKFRLPQSCIHSENTNWFVAQKIAAFLKSVVISFASNYAWYTGTSWIIEFTGIVFVSFEIADLCFLSTHNILILEYFLHHTIHIFLGFHILFQCNAGHLATVLLSQETSGIFLNLFLLLRNRLSSKSLVTNILFVGFCITFAVWRVFFATLATVQHILIQNDITGMFATAGCLMQWFWAMHIVKKIKSQMQRP